MLHTALCCSHEQLTNQHLPFPLLCSLPLPKFMCQNALGFLPCLPVGGGISLRNDSHSWQLESCWFSWSQAALLCPRPTLFCCWPTTRLLEGVEGGDWSRGWLTSLRFAQLPELCSEQAVLNVRVEFLTKGRKVCFPLTGPQNVRKARYLCGWILGGLC